MILLNTLKCYLISKIWKKQEMAYFLTDYVLLLEKLKCIHIKRCIIQLQAKQSLCSLGAYNLVGKTDNTDTPMQVYKTMSGSDNCHEGNLEG